MKLHTDKLLHFGVGMLIAAAVTSALCLFVPGDRYVAYGLGVFSAGAAGMMKEAFDTLHEESHSSDPWDFVATLAGGIVGTIVAALIIETLR